MTNRQRRDNWKSTERVADEFHKVIPIAELCVGMQVIPPRVNWSGKPQHYGKELFIDSPETLKKIKALGIAEVTIDLARSADALFTKDLPKNPIFKHPALAFKQADTLAEELPKAAQAHSDCIAYARRFMTAVNFGRANFSAATDLVQNMMSSVERNPDALLTLAWMHRCDSYTYVHCVNVSILATCFSRFLGHSEEEVFTAGVSGLFHDLGKALIPQNILNAPRKLSEKEFCQLRKHPELGHEELSKVPGISPDVLLGALEHHEKFDGSGYPKRLSGYQISRVGSITAIADVYDALTSRRVYKGAMYPHKALGIMYNARNKEFATEYVEQFIRMVGIYPVGSIVLLEDKCLAVVVASNPERPTQPKVLIVRGEKGQTLFPPQPYQIVEGGPTIAACIPPEKTTINPHQVLGIKEYNRIVA